MKSVDQIIGYLEGRYSILKNFEPERVEAYVIRDILDYIKEDENNEQKNRRNKSCGSL